MIDWCQMRIYQADFFINKEILVKRDYKQYHIRLKNLMPMLKLILLKEKSLLQILLQHMPSFLYHNYLFQNKKPFPFYADRKMLNLLALIVEEPIAGLLMTLAYSQSWIKTAKSLLK